MLGRRTLSRRLKKGSKQPQPRDLGKAGDLLGSQSLMVREIYSGRGVEKPGLVFR